MTDVKTESGSEAHEMSDSLPPPPPRYPVSNNGFNTTTSPGVTVLTTEAANVISHPTGPDYQLVVGEGTYILRDDLHLATPPPQSSDTPAVNLNPLATTPVPPTSGIKLSLSIANPYRVSPQLYKLNAFGSTRSHLATYSIRESEKESRTSHETGGDDMPQPMAEDDSERPPELNEGTSVLSPATGKEGLKRRKPKTNLMKSNSSFISRVIPHDALSKRLQEQNPEAFFIFANINRAFQWLDLSCTAFAKTEYMIKILFSKAHMLCHDINSYTKGLSHLDVIMGASSADIMWFEAYSQKYNRINKNCIINPAPVSEIKWLPGSENLFLAAHMDGTLIVYDKERDDATFVPEERRVSVEDSNDGFESDHAPLHINKSVNSKNQKANPVASWKLSNHRINGFAFSPDNRHLAVVSEDGSLRIINYLKELLTDIYTSYYGGLICVCWSPDGKYVLTGGQDDLVSIWSLGERRIVARCAGHQSWVTAVAFDPWRCDDRNYRFGSVGEDRRLLLWDFNVGMLRRPKAASIRQRASISSHQPLSRNRAESQATNRLRSNSSLTSNIADEEALIEHPVESRSQTAELPPVMSKIVDDDPMSWIGFEEDCIITACAAGHIRIWDRPRDGVTGSQVVSSESRSSP